MSRPTFAELYCARHGLEPDAYLPTVFRRALYPHTRLVVTWLRLMDSDYFAADYDLVQAAGRIRSLRDYAGDAVEFNHHPANQGVLRRVLRLRVSVRRLRALIRTTLPGRDSASPFPPSPTTSAPP